VDPLREPLLNRKSCSAGNRNLTPVPKRRYNGSEYGSFWSLGEGRETLNLLGPLERAKLTRLSLAI
jgi:hypothetical protein